jgi:hypothetical protein
VKCIEGPSGVPVCPLVDQQQVQLLRRHALQHRGAAGHGRLLVLLPLLVLCLAVLGWLLAGCGVCWRRAAWHRPRSPSQNQR